jgi:hypothetical protein
MAPSAACHVRPSQKAVSGGGLLGTEVHVEERKDIWASLRASKIAKTVSVCVRLTEDGIDLSYERLARTLHFG